MTKTVLQALLVLLTLLPLHTNCVVNQCLFCPINTPADCTSVILSPQITQFNCTADLSNCNTSSPCNSAVDQLCVSGFSLTPNNMWNYHANCFDEFNASCPSCEVHTSRGLVVECCCIENNCFDGTAMSQQITTTDPRAISTATTTTTTTTTPMESPLSVTPIIIGVIAALLALLIVVALSVILCHCRHKLWRFCCSWRQKTSQTSIDRSFSGRYSQPWVLLGLVGQGRFGHVYKALYNGDEVAVKMYSHHNRTTWENERNLFSLESTRHPNIIYFVASDSSESGGVAVNASPLQLYLVTRYHPLGSLEEYLRAHVISWKQACVMVRSIACGLKHLHSESFVNEAGITSEKYSIAHRDIKSSNILMQSEAGECVIADLGLAMQLIPINDPKEVSNYGQVGTVRYMSPEALEARVNLMDIQSFKQIDIYAFSLVMWEVMSRCCILTSEDLGAYQLPYADLVLHPTLEVMKDIVCSRQLRPSIPSLWSNHEPLLLFTEIVQESWDKEPDARPTAANIIYRMDDLCNSSPQNVQDQITQSYASSTSHTPLDNSQSHPPPDVRPLFFQEHSQSSPPPCYSPTDPIPFSATILNQENGSRMRPARNYFQTSLPHIMQVDQEREGYASILTLTPRCARSLRTSGMQSPYGQNNWEDQDQPHPSLSVRNSLVLGGRTQVLDDLLPTFSDTCLENTSSSSHSIGPLPLGTERRGQSEHLDGAEMRPSDMKPSYNNTFKLDLDIPNADSGIQISHSNTSRSTVQSLQSNEIYSPDPVDIDDTVGVGEGDHEEEACLGQQQVAIETTL